MQVATDYPEDETCFADGPAAGTIWFDGQEGRAGVDIADDGSLDVIRIGDAIYFRTEATSIAGASTAWVEVSAQSDDTFNRFARMTHLDPLGFALLEDFADPFDDFQKLEDDGEESPMGDDPVNGPILRWTVDESGSITSAEVTRAERQGGYSSRLTRLDQAPPAPLQAPRDEDVGLLADAPVLPFLLQSEGWTVDCGPPLPDDLPERRDCLSALADGVSVSEWIGGRESNWFAAAGC